MVGSAANVTSLESMKRFRLALLEYEHDMRDTLAMLALEAHRALDWIDNDRGRYWPAAVRKASDRLSEARITLERKEIAIRPEDKESCVDEKKAYERAKRRLRFCEGKVQEVKKWALKARREADEFQGGVAKLTGYIDIDLPRAVAEMENMIEALERYAAATAPPPTGDALKQAAAILDERPKPGSPS